MTVYRKMDRAIFLFLLESQGRMEKPPKGHQLQQHLHLMHQDRVVMVLEAEETVQVEVDELKNLNLSIQLVAEVLPVYR